MGFVFANDRDVRIVAEMIRAQRMYGDILITPPIVQDPGPQSEGSGSNGGSGGGGSGDLETITIGPYLTNVTVECVIGSGGVPQLVVTREWGISHITGNGLSLTQEVYSPPSGS